MRAVILAAGRGLRLNGVCGNLPKCLLEVGALTLIERQIRDLRSVGIDELFVVVGFGADRVRSVCGSDAQCIDNPHFDQTNSLYSLWLARRYLTGDFVVMNSDVLFHPDLLRSLVNSRFCDALLV